MAVCNYQAVGDHQAVGNRQASLALMQRAAAYIAVHYSSQLRMVDLATHCHLSVRSLQNLFHLHCGEPPLRALRRYRLQHLHRALAQRPWQPLAQHYRACGLSGAEADRQLFAAMYALSVRDYQRACRQQHPHPPQRLVALPPVSLERFLPQAS